MLKLRHNALQGHSASLLWNLPLTAEEKPWPPGKTAEYGLPSTRCQNDQMRFCKRGGSRPTPKVLINVTIAVLLEMLGTG